MAEPTLSLAYADFMGDIAEFLGYDRDAVLADSETLATAEAKQCDRYVQSGYALFLTPPPLKDEKESHAWLFLSVRGTLATDSTNEDYDAADDFGSLDGPLSYAPTAYLAGPDLRDEGMIRQLRATNPRTGRPTVFAIRPKAATGETGQRWEFLLYPKPDAVYTITYPYNVLRNKLSVLFPYPLGGTVHGRAIQQACRAVAEQQGLRQPGGPEWLMFLTLLEASVTADRRNAPSVFRPLRSPWGDDEGARSRVVEVTYNGVLYGPTGV